jgi:hypothetical protein
MDKKTIVNNGWVTDVAVACDNNVTVDSDLFEACITHADVRELVYGENVAAVNEPVDETPEVIDETPEVVDETPEVVDETPEVVDEPDPVEPEA